MIVRPNRPLHSQLSQSCRPLRAALVAASVASVLFGMAVSSDVHAQASAAVASSAAQYTVKPGQSLTDIAGEISGSTDKTVRQNMARAIFDANPNAFSRHDPSKMRLGSVLNLPVAASTAASEAPAASTPAAASEPAAPAVVAPSAASSSPVIAASPLPAASSAPVVVSAPSAAAPVAASTPANVATGATVSGVVAGAPAGASIATAPVAGGASDTTAVVASSGVQAASDVAAPAVASAPAAAPTVASAVPLAAPVAEGPDAWSERAPMILLVAVVVLIALLMFALVTAQRRRRARLESELSDPEVDTDAQAVAWPAVSTEGPFVSQPRDEPVAAQMHDHDHARDVAPTGAADLDGVALQRGQSELNGVAAGIENYDAAQTFETPTDDIAVAVPVPSQESRLVDLSDKPAEPLSEVAVSHDVVAAPSAPVATPEDAQQAREVGARRAPFVPDAPASLHRAFIPPRPAEVAAALAAERAIVEAREQAERQAREEEARLAAQREAEARLVAQREAEAREQAEREAREEEARAVAQREAEAREQAEREAREEEARAVAQREAEAREQAQRDAREEEARLVAQREAEAREQAERDAREEEARLVAQREAEAHEQAEREAREEEARLVAQREAEAHEQAEREAREEARLVAQREAEAREQAEREAREEEARLVAQREAEAREQAEREAREEAARVVAHREAEAREQAEREAREEEARVVAHREAEAREEEQQRLAAQHAAEAREQAERAAHEDAERTAAHQETAAREQSQREAYEAEAQWLAQRDSSSASPHDEQSNQTSPYSDHPQRIEPEIFQSRENPTTFDRDQDHQPEQGYAQHDDAPRYLEPDAGYPQHDRQQPAFDNPQSYVQPEHVEPEHRQDFDQPIHSPHKDFLPHPDHVNARPDDSHRRDNYDSNDRNLHEPQRFEPEQPFVTNPAADLGHGSAFPHPPPQYDELEEASPYDDEPSRATPFPQPSFPRAAIEALDTPEFSLPPRQDLADTENAAHQPEHNAPPASVAGMGASRFGPLSLDFDYNQPASHTSPLPAFTPEQVATIAHNKLDLASEYISLGDLSGARTLLQEVIESNDPATRQRAATLLSTLAPLS